MSLNRVIATSVIFSDCGKYRYHLTRYFASGLGTCLFVMLNPSTADSKKDDRTVRRCIGYAMLWGRARLIVVNIFALRSKDPKVLYKHPDPAGPENNTHIASPAEMVQSALCQWRPTVHQWVRPCRRPPLRGTGAASPVATKELVSRPAASTMFTMRMAPR